MADERKKTKALKFRRIGKYFLIVLVLVAQGALAYTIIDENYERIYSYVQSFMPNESGQFDLEQIIVNPAETNGQRYLLVELSLELVNKDGIELVKENRSKIRNNLIKHLSAHSVSELQGVKEKEDLRIELVRIINQAIGRRSVRNLYYSKYVMQ